jgi:NitT/TauT family transport system permease protein
MGTFSLQKENSLRKKVFLGILGFLIMLALWGAITYSGLVKPLFLPSPTGVLDNTIDLFVNQNFLSDIFASIWRVLVGFLFASIIAVPLGIFIGTYKSIQGIVGPIVEFMRYLPAAAFVPLAILWLGIGDIEKMFIIFIGTLPYLTVLVADVVKHVNQDLINVGHTLGATDKQIMFDIIIPSSMPMIWDSLRVMAGIGWTYIIVAEIVAARSGIGHVIIEAQRYLLTANIITGLIIIGVIGLITDYAFKYFGRKFFPWNEGSK